MIVLFIPFYFFFQAEDGIRGGTVTGVQTCALPISQVRTTLDCTSGWYSQQDWTGVPLRTLLHRGPGAQSVYVHSVTGYWVRRSEERREGKSVDRRGRRNIYEDASVGTRKSGRARRK